MEEDQFFELLKKKGTGHTMSKHLTDAELAQLKGLFESEKVSLESKATMLTAFKFLDNTPQENNWYQTYAYAPLKDLYFPTQDKGLLSFYHRIAGQAFLTENDMFQAMDALFDENELGWVKAAFLEALRLRRESETENTSALTWCLKKASHTDTGLPFLIDLASPYDGLNRSCLVLPFLGMLLGVLGYPCVLHGVKDMGPKYGMTPSKLLSLMNYPVDHSLNEAKNALCDSGFAYVDQSVFFPSLYQFQSLRRLMLKRPLFATIEKLLLPLRAKKNYILASYTHPPYKQMMSFLLNQDPLHENWTLIRGEEGSVQLPLDRRCPLVTKEEDGFISPEDFGLSKSDTVFFDSHTLIKQAYDAFSGQKNQVYERLLYQASFLIHHISKGEKTRVVKQVKEALDSKKVLSSFSPLFDYFFKNKVQFQ